MGSRGRRTLAIVLLATAPGCGVQNLNFVQDQRLEIVEPSDRTIVTEPITIRWTIRDFEVTGPDAADRTDAGYFGVFVDRAPQPPGRDLAWLVRDDQRCRRTPGCPDEAFLAQRNIHGTSDTSLVLESLPHLADEDRRDVHEVTIVLLNGRGQRIGETATTVEFEVERP